MSMTYVALDVYPCYDLFKSTCSWPYARRTIYERFYEAFSDSGEPNIPVDKELMKTPEFYSLLDRLRLHAEQHNRDHWSAHPCHPIAFMCPVRSNVLA